MAQFMFKTKQKQNITKQKKKTNKHPASQGGGTSPSDIPLFLNVKARFMPLYANKEAYIRT